MLISFLWGPTFELPFVKESFKGIKRSRLSGHENIFCSSKNHFFLQCWNSVRILGMALAYHYDPSPSSRLFSPSSAYCLETRVVAEEKGGGGWKCEIPPSPWIWRLFVVLFTLHGRRGKGGVNRYPPPSVPTLLFAPPRLLHCYICISRKYSVLNSISSSEAGEAADGFSHFPLPPLEGKSRHNDMLAAPSSSKNPAASLIVWARG